MNDRTQRINYLARFACTVLVLFAMDFIFGSPTLVLSRVGPLTASVDDSSINAGAAKPAATPIDTGTKKNGRPEKVPVVRTQTDDYKPTYFYEFTRPGFLVPHIFIEHDATGKGKITFQKKDVEDLITDPIQLTPGTVSRINDTLAKLDFLNSTEDYQYEKDRSNMGNIVFRFVRDGRDRTIKLNWTLNPEAKALMDAYQRIGIEAVWKFELTAVRTNQPLVSPRMLEELDGYLKRDEISDPSHLVPLLKELVDDERLPLIARNHAARLIDRIQKLAK